MIPSYLKIEILVICDEFVTLGHKGLTIAKFIIILLNSQKIEKLLDCSKFEVIFMIGRIIELLYIYKGSNKYRDKSFISFLFLFSTIREKNLFWSILRTSNEI